MGRVSPVAWFAALAFIAVAFSGCAGETPIITDGSGEAPKVDATSSTGGIRGVVVDSTITPIEGASIVVLQTGDVTQTDTGGAFVISGLEPGSYVVEASHPFYDTVQQTTVVEAGVDNPPALKMQLTQQIFASPFMDTLSFNGYIFCSANVVGAYSEECGEGLGYPCEVPETVYGCGDRIAKNENNEAGAEWYMSGDGLRHMTVEQAWEPSLEISASGGGQFRTFIAVNWLCDPWCGSDYGFGAVVSTSPLWGEVKTEQLEAAAERLGNLTTDTRFTTFTYAADNPGLMIEQEYETFVTMSYWLSPPEGWSFINGDPNPF